MQTVAMDLGIPTAIEDWLDQTAAAFERGD